MHVTWASSRPTCCEGWGGEVGRGFGTLLVLAHSSSVRHCWQGGSTTGLFIDCGRGRRRRWCLYQTSKRTEVWAMVHATRK